MHGSVRQKSDNMHCSHNFPTAVNVPVNPDVCSSLMQACNKLAAGPGCNPVFTPRRLRLDPSSTTSLGSQRKQTNGRGFFRAASVETKQRGDLKSQSPARVQMVILYLLSFVHASISCHQIKVRHGTRHRGCEGSSSVRGSKVDVWSRRQNEKNLLFGKSAFQSRPVGGPPRLGRMFVRRVAAASAGPVVTLLKKTCEKQNTYI